MIFARRAPGGPINTWREVTAPVEYETSGPLIGWRISAVSKTGTVLPFDANGYAHAICATNDAHCRGDGKRLYVHCQCGIYLTDTPEHAIEFWRAAGKFMRARTRELLGAENWAGLVACRIATAGTVSLGGKPRTQLFRSIDPEGTYRTSSAELVHVYTPREIHRDIPGRIQETYPRSAVTELQGPLRVVTARRYQQTP